MPHNNLCSHFEKANQIIVYHNNKKTTLSKGDDKFEIILESLQNITEHAHEMPAFAVAENKNTIDALQTGLWIELVFNATKIYNDMPFDALLIEVNKDFSGFNLIRKLNGKYDGRCFYLNLKDNMHTLEKSLKNIC